MKFTSFIRTSTKTHLRFQGLYLFSFKELNRWLHKGKRKPKHEIGNPREQRQEKLASAIQRIAFN